MDARKKQVKTGKDKSPFMRREEAITSKAFKAVDKSVKAVAKDTNKTRRKTTKSRIVGETVKKEKPISNLKKDMKKSMRSGCY